MAAKMVATTFISTSLFGKFYKIKTVKITLYVQFIKDKHVLSWSSSRHDWLIVPLLHFYIGKKAIFALVVTTFLLNLNNLDTLLIQK